MNNFLEINNLRLKFNNNISFIVYDDYITKNDLLSLIINKISKGDFLITNQEFELKNEPLYIDLNNELKKEFTLSKTSVIRKKLIREIINYFDENNIEINNFFNNEIGEKIIEFVKKEFKTNSYTINLVNKVETIADMIDGIFKLSISNLNGSEIPSKNFNQFSLNEVYIEMMLSNEIKNELIIIDDYDMYSFDNGNKLIESIIKLSKNNLIILTSNKSFFLEKNYFFMESINLYLNSEIFNLKISNTIFEKYLLLKDYEGEISEYDFFEVNSKYLIDDNDIFKTKIIFQNSISNIFSRLKNNDEINVSYLNEFIYFILKIFIEMNNDIFKLKLIYKNKKSELLKYIENKY